MCSLYRAVECLYKDSFRVRFHVILAAKIYTLPKLNPGYATGLNANKHDVVNKMQVILQNKMDVPAWTDFVRNKNVAPSPTRQIFFRVFSLETFYMWAYKCTVVQCIVDCNIGDIRSNLLADAVDIVLLAAPASRHVLLSLIDLQTDSAFDINALKLIS